LEKKVETQKHVHTPEQLREVADTFWDPDDIDLATLPVGM